MLIAQVEPQQRVELCLAHYERAVLPLAGALVVHRGIEPRQHKYICFTDSPASIARYWTIGRPARTRTPV